MKHHTVIAFAFLLLLSGTLGTGCGDGGEAGAAGTPQPGSATFGHEEGVDLVTGEVMDPGTFANSDLFAKTNGDLLKLYSGGETSAKNRPVEWFQNGGTADDFESLDDVPSTPLPTDDGLPLTHASAQNGFIVQASDGTYFKGYILSASATSLTLEYEPLQ